MIVRAGGDEMSTTLLNGTRYVDTTALGQSAGGGLTEYSRDEEDGEEKQDPRLGLPLPLHDHGFCGPIEVVSALIPRCGVERNPSQEKGDSYIHVHRQPVAIATTGCTPHALTSLNLAQIT